jgi:hypothetical protein
LANLEAALNQNNANVYLVNQNAIPQQAGFMSPATLRVNLAEQQRINQLCSVGGGGGGGGGTNELEANGYQMMFMNLLDANLSASQVQAQTQAHAQATSCSGAFQQSINTTSDVKQSTTNSFNNHEKQTNNNEQINHDHLNENKENRIYESSSMEELDNNKCEQEPMLSSHYASNILSIKQKQQQQQQNFQKYNINIGENSEEERQLI